MRFPTFDRVSCVLVVLFIGTMIPLGSTATAARPNVLFVLCDDIRHDALGIAGHPYLKTPHIDELANEGVWFKNTFCTTSLCSPSRASILSGLYAHTHGVVNNFTEYPTEMVSFPLHLQRHGYETAYIGKWHMGEENDDPRPGFDWFVTHKGQGSYFDTAFNVNGEGAKTVPGYYTHVVTDMAIDWLNRDHAGKPWMLMIGQKAPHSFYFPEPKYEKVFDHVWIPYPESAFRLDDKPLWIRDRLTTWHGIYGPLFDWRKNFPDSSPEAVKDFAAMTRAYHGTILSVDDSMGKLVKELERRGELDNTVIVFMGDNGLLNGEHGMIDKRTAHEPSIRVPLVIRYPGLAPAKSTEAGKSAKAKVVEEQVLTVDLAPTLVELCGAPRLENIHGKSFVKLVMQGDDDWRDAWFYHYNYEKQFPYTPNVRSIRTESWKYIRYPHGDGSPDRHMAELYNIEFDPEERHNLIKSEKYASIVEELKATLLQLMLETGLDEKSDKMPIDEGVKSELPDKAIR